MLQVVQQPMGCAMQHVMVEYYDWTGVNKVTSAPEQFEGDIPGYGSIIPLGDENYFVMELLPADLRECPFPMPRLRVMEVTSVS